MIKCWALFEPRKFDCNQKTKNKKIKTKTNLFEILPFWNYITKMFINDIRKEFFDLLQNERILVVAGMDVDSVCAVKILQTLLQCDNIKYTLVPVRGVSDLILAFEEHTGKDSGVKYVMNCILRTFMHIFKKSNMFLIWITFWHSGCTY